MQNTELQEYQPISTPISKRLARQSATSASNHFASKNGSRRNGLAGRLALYTWGFLSSVCIVFASALLITEIKIYDTIQNTELATLKHRNSRSFQPQYTSSDIPQNTTPNRDLVLALMPASEVDTTITGSIGKVQDRVESAQTNGFGVVIGEPNSTKALASRYLALANHAPELFVSLKPKIKFTKMQDKKEAKLVVGPFMSESELSNFCEGIRTRLALHCIQESYTGRRLLLPPIL